MVTALDTAVTLMQSLLSCIVDLFAIPWFMVCGLFVVVGLTVSAFKRLTS